MHEAQFAYLFMHPFTPSHFDSFVQKTCYTAKNSFDSFSSLILGPSVGHYTASLLLHINFCNLTYLQNTANRLQIFYILICFHYVLSFTSQNQLCFSSGILHIKIKLAVLTKLQLLFVLKIHANLLKVVQFSNCF